MTRLLTLTAAAALAGSAALADQSTRYNDLRLDTSENADRVFSDAVRPTDGDRAQRGRDQRAPLATPDAMFSTRSDSEIASPGQGYPYGGYGPGNDSR